MKRLPEEVPAHFAVLPYPVSLIIDPPNLSCFHFIKKKKIIKGTTDLQMK